jgi:predicted ABC-type ATPase
MRIEKKQDFAFETTLAGRSYLKLIERLQKMGWQVELVYLALPSLEMSKLRVAERVAHGGHNIPTKDITRRFPRSLQNLLVHFSYQVDRARCFMNSGDTQELIFEQQNDDRTIIHEHYYQLLIKESGL